MKAAALLFVLLLLVVGCNDMTTQPRQKQYSPAAGPSQEPDGMILYKSRPAPVPSVTLALLQRGQEQFRVFCTPCHSELGDGNGMVVQRGFPHPPSYAEARLRAAPVEHFYDVIAHGYGAMDAYDDRVQAADRWAIAAYIRALQLSQHATLADVTPAERKLLR
jgi:mono/diheme cytochrome c family protein